MKKFLLFIVTMALCIPVQADVVVYKNLLRSTRTGGGMIVKASITGWALFDPSTGAATLIFANDKEKKFVVQSPTNTIAIIDSRRHRYHLLQLHTGFVKNMTGKGLVHTLVEPAFSNGMTYAPRNYTVSGADLYKVGSTAFYNEYKGSMVYHRGHTASFNQLQTPMAHSVLAFRNGYWVNGYVEVESF